MGGMRARRRLGDRWPMGRASLWFHHQPVAGDEEEEKEFTFGLQLLFLLSTNAGLYSATDFVTFVTKIVLCQEKCESTRRPCHEHDDGVSTASSSIGRKRERERETPL